MLGMNVKTAKSNFFDRDAVLSRVGRKKGKVMNKAGGLVRKIAQHSMRYRKAASTPGSPPSAHKNGMGPLMRKFLFYALDPSTDTVVVGPARLVKSTDAPAIEEFGGTVRRQRKGKVTTAVYPARPYMGPAAKTAAPEILDLWKDVVTP
jgi:phage gpG-like protein